MSTQKFRDGIIDIHTRQFGTVAEVVVYKGVRQY